MPMRTNWLLLAALLLSAGLAAECRSIEQEGDAASTSAETDAATDSSGSGGSGQAAAGVTLASAGQQAHGYACDHGCPSAYQPVCGADGHTYSNECLAMCQGVDVASSGACQLEAILHTLGAVAQIEAGVEGGGAVPRRHLDAFSAEGFRYAGQVMLTTDPKHVGPAAPCEMSAAAAAAAATRQHPQASTEAAAEGAEGTEGAEALRRPGFVRVTRDGHVYHSDAGSGVSEHLRRVLSSVAGAAVGHTRAGAPLASRMAPASDTAAAGFAAASASASGSAAAATAGAARAAVAKAAALAAELRRWGSANVSSPTEAAEAAPGRGAGAGRSLLGLFGTDDRVDCPLEPTYPFTAIGQLLVKDSTGAYVCSGTLIGPDVVLTAGHCVYNRTTQAFYSLLDFAPGRTRDSATNQLSTPFGAVPWAHVTMYQEYADPKTADPNALDLAVIRLATPIGMKTGWMGLQKPCTAEPQYVAYTAGYPNDKPSGSCKTTQCAVDQTSCQSDYLYHRCDTAQGQSGSAMWWYALTPEMRVGPYVRGVHNIEWVVNNPSGGTSVYINSAVSLTPAHYNSVLTWIAGSFEANTPEVEYATLPIGTASQQSSSPEPDQPGATPNSGPKPVEATMTEKARRGSGDEGSPAPSGAQDPVSSLEGMQAIGGGAQARVGFEPAGTGATAQGGMAAAVQGLAMVQGIARVESGSAASAASSGARVIEIIPHAHARGMSRRLHAVLGDDWSPRHRSSSHGPHHGHVGAEVAGKLLLPARAGLGVAKRQVGKKA